MPTKIDQKSWAFAERVCRGDRAQERLFWGSVENERQNYVYAYLEYDSRAELDDLKKS